MLFVLAAGGLAFAALAGRSFWIDEAMLALAVQETGNHWSKPLALYEQATPYGHYLLSRLALDWGARDLGLRLISMGTFLAGLCLSLTVLPRARWRALLAVGVFLCPEVLRYATEYKHYILEFAFSLLLASAWVALPDRRAGRVYAAALLLSTVLTYSVVLVAVAIFLLESWHRWREGTPLRSWLALHLLYGMLFVLIYVCHVRPSIALQMGNWPEIYQSGLLSLHAQSLEVWLRLPDGIIRALGGRSLLLSGTAFLVAIALAGARPAMLSALTLRLGGLVMLVCGLIVAASLAGAYPIQGIRHLLFVSALVLLFLVGVVADLSRFKTSVGWALAAAALALGGHAYLRHNFHFQEVKPLLARSSGPIGLVFLGAQPAFQWYSPQGRASLPEGKGYVNDTSAERLQGDPNTSSLNAQLQQPGAWSWIWSLRQHGQFPKYLEWLAKTAEQRSPVQILFAHTTGGLMVEFVRRLPPGCRSEVIDQEPDAYLLSVRCQP